MQITKSLLKNHIHYPELLWSIAVVGMWRVLIQIYAVFVLHRFPLSDTIYQKLYFLTIWSNYDGDHYVSIAQKGYNIIEYAFFPLFPLTIKIISWPATSLMGDKESIYILVALLITTISLVGAIYFLLLIARQIFDIESGKRAVLLILFFPAAIFLGAVYTESFFLLWVTGSFYFGLKRNWLWAGIFGAAAAATRSVGLIMFACLLIEFFLANRQTWRQQWRQALPLLLIPGALIAYMIYQWLLVGSPVQFLDAQKNWGREVSASVFITLWQDYVRGFNLIDFNETRVAPLYDGLATIFGIVLAGVLAWKRMWSFALFTAAVTTISLTSGTTVGAIRYVMVAFPAFLLLGSWGKHQIVYGLLLAFFAIIFAVLSIHYLNMWWLA